MQIEFKGETMDTKKLIIRLDEETKKMLKIKCVKEGVSMNSVIINLIKKHLTK